MWGTHIHLQLLNVTQEGSVDQLECRSTLLFKFKRMNLVISFPWNIYFFFVSSCFLTLLSSISSFGFPLPLPWGTSQRNCLIPSMKEIIDVGLGTRLKGTGSVPPYSKYDSHSLALANFHSTSESSCTNRRGNGEEGEETFDVQQVNIQRFNHMNQLPNYVK